jgi:N-acetylneuraminic acid mutarotase
MGLRSVVRASSGGSRRRQLLAKLCVGAIVVTALVTSIVSLALAATTSFPDVPATHQYYAAITDLASRSVIGGYANGNFGPSDPVTRQQFAKMIVLTGGYPVSESDVCQFIDVAKGDATTFYPDNYVAVCAAKGITTGTSPTTFNPTGKITRYQVVSMVVRMADNLQPGLLVAPPAGWTGNATWANNATHGANAARAEYNGLLTGLDLVALSPTGDMNRGEVAQVLHNLLGKLTPTTTSTATGSSTTTTTAATTTTTTASTTTTTTAPSRTWTNLHPGGSLPSARDSHCMVYNPANGKVILFGGSDKDGNSLRDTWAYDPTANTWTDLRPTGSVPPEGDYSMVYDSARGMVILVGEGSDDAVFCATWAYDSAANTWTELHPTGSVPPARLFRSMVYDPATGRVILFGGLQLSFETLTFAYFNDTWAYDSAANTWTELHPTGSLPPAREGHAMVYDPASGKVILFGGSGEGFGYLNDTWAYDPTAKSWASLTPTGDLPSAREYHSMVYDSAAGKMILFGGWNDSAEFNDTWAYDPTANRWASLTPTGEVPSARDSHAMVYDSATGKMILFGGCDENAEFNDTWAYGVTP